MKLDYRSYKIFALGFRCPTPDLIEGFRGIPLFDSSLKGISVEALRKEHTRIFSLCVSGGLPPYETEYGIKDIFLKTQIMADIGGFYRAFGMEIAESGEQRVDYIGTELEFMFFLGLKEHFANEEGEKDKAQIVVDATKKFLRDHLSRWVPFLGKELERISTVPFYQNLGRSLSQFVESECKRLDVQPGDVIFKSQGQPSTSADIACEGGCAD